LANSGDPWLGSHELSVAVVGYLADANQPMAAQAHDGKFEPINSRQMKSVMWLSMQLRLLGQVIPANGCQPPAFKHLAAFALHCSLLSNRKRLQ
jgi:hypothetical protein